MMFVVLLLLAASADKAPPIKCVSTPDYDCKTGVYSGPPVNEVSALDQETAVEIYRAYWTCYWTNVRNHPDFGSTLAEKVSGSFKAASLGCTQEREAADSGMEALLAANVRYGDQPNRVQLRDRFRQTGGIMAGYLAFGQSGHRIEFLNMLTAITPKNSESDNAPN